MIASFFFVSALLETIQQIDDLNQYNNFLILGYFAMWAVVMIYLLLLANRQRNIREDLKVMAQLLREDKEEDVV